MKLSTLNSISPIDGRYRGKTKTLSHYFSEQALIQYRVRVEIEYFIALCKIPLPQLENLNPSIFEDLRSIYKHFSEEDAKNIKEIEKITNHDVKAVEYFIKKEFDKLDLEKYKEFIHFGLTSQDINNTAIPLSIKEALHKTYLPHLEEVLETLSALSEACADTPMLSRTHGQPASPTLMGKEIAVFSNRLEIQKASLMKVQNAAKFAGATGNFNAHQVAYPDINWKAFGKNFVEEQLGLDYSFPTTQIEHYDNIAALCDALKRINTILIDFNRDIWTYISIDYFKQIIKDNEVGSSAMPHKVNPIDFENAEGNLGMANALLNFFAGKLPISRLQRDLTDSTVLRNIGVPFGHILIAFKSMVKGIEKLIINPVKIEADLNENWSIIAEAIQTILRREKYPNPYEALKDLTRTNSVVNKKLIHEFIDSLNIQENVKQELRQITPSNYIGIAK
jgi:adenylosuccinate lyase